MQRRTFLASVAATAAASAFPVLGYANTQYPSRSIMWIVPFTPGGITDHVSRMVGKLLTERLKQPIVVENRGGAGGTLGTIAAARANPDGYTILYGTQGTMAANPSLYTTLRYDPLKDFIPVHGMFATPNVVVVNGKSPFHTLDEFIAYAKEHPGELNMASAGVGTGSHLAGEVFQQAAGIQLTHVPYKGSGPALNDMLGGMVDILFDYQVSSATHIASGALRALAVTSKSRLTRLPDIPSLYEAGYPNAVSTSWSGVFLPAGSPQEIVDLLAETVADVLTTSEIKSYCEEFGSQALQGMSKEKFSEFIAQETTRWRDVIAYAGVKLD